MIIPGGCPFNSCLTWPRLWSLRSPPFVSDIPAMDGKIANLFLQCTFNCNPFSQLQPRETVRLPGLLSLMSLCGAGISTLSPSAPHPSSTSMIIPRGSPFNSCVNWPRLWSLRSPQGEFGQWHSCYGRENCLPFFTVYSTFNYNPVSQLQPRERVLLPGLLSLMSLCGAGISTLWPSAPHPSSTLSSMLSTFTSSGSLVNISPHTP